LKELGTAKFVEAIDVSVNLGVDPRKSDQNVRGATVLPNGTGKTVRVAVFTQGPNADAAKAAVQILSAWKIWVSWLKKANEFRRGNCITRCDESCRSAGSDFRPERLDAQP